MLIMALQTCGLNLNRVSRELQPHGTSDFPCAGYSSTHTDKPEDSIPWHWHEELEIILITKGTLRVQIPGCSFCLEKGDCLALNSNILHYASTETFGELQSIVFHPSLIAGDHDSVFARKYIHPLLFCPSFQSHVWCAGETTKIPDAFCRAFHSLAQDSPGFEFIVRENLSIICFSLYSFYEKEIAVEDTALNSDRLRIKEMLDFIHHNYFDCISLTDIARVSDIGERECLRCFQRTIQLSPMQYLLKYRIMRGAKFLTENPASSISEIANMCGFDSPSNFSKMFRRFYCCSPREYKHTHAE